MRFISELEERRPKRLQLMELIKEQASKRSLKSGKIDPATVLRYAESASAAKHQ